MLLTILAAQSPAADSLRLMAAHLSESALVVAAKARPQVGREAVTQALARRELQAASRLAAAYAAAWSDSFLVREVARFAEWPPERRADKVWADSVRRVGVAAYSRDGPTAAIAIWRRALVRVLAIPDTAGVAAVLGNIGAGFLEEGRTDSAAAYLERARLLASSIGDLRVEANAVLQLAGVSEERGDFAGARERYARALALHERIGDTRGLAADHNNLGLLAQTAGDRDEARRQFDAALALNRRDGRDEIAAANLVNLAGLASLAGDFVRAQTLYRDALATWRSHERWADAASALRGLGQLELRRGDYPAARSVLREALDIYERTGPFVEAIAVRRELAAALAARGELQGALDELRRAQARTDSMRAPPAVRAGIALARGDLAVQLNARAQAERLYSRAEFLYRQAGDAGGVAEAQMARGTLALERNAYAVAQSLLSTAMRTHLTAGNRRAAALVRLSLGRLAQERDDTAGARREFVRAAADLEAVGDPVAAAAALGERASLETDAGLPVVAESLFRAGLERLSGRIAPEVAWRLHAGLGLARRAQRDVEEATRQLRAAVAELERPSRSLALAERRSGFLADKWDVYAELALTERERGRPGAAFEASERLRAREMMELLARGRIAQAPDTAADLVEREQDLRRRIGELTHDLEAPLGGGGGTRGPEAGRPDAGGETLARAQETYAELLLDMRERAPRHAALVAVEIAAWRDVARRLAPDQAFLEYLVSDSGSLAFVVTRDTLAILDLGVGRREVARLVRFARGTLERRGSPATDSLWRGPLRQLHARLIAPIEDAGLLAGKTRLVLVPHAELHYLPFAALLRNGGQQRFLVERYELAFTPSATVWLALGRSAARASGGVLAFAPRPEALPASRREVAAIARLTDATVLTGNAASEEAFRRAAPNGRVLHLASFGVLNSRNPLFSFVELAPGGGHDGRLEVHEVFGLRLQADLVVLSACQTGLGSGALADVPAGDDWVGLTRAFLHAGARQVVATLWPVDDWATAALMEAFYGKFGPSSDRTRELAGAQRAMLATPATAHPFYWAGFVAVSGSGVNGAAP